MEINFDGLQKFLKDFKELVERAERAEQGLIKLLGAENAKNLVEEMEHLKKRIDSNMKVTQDGIKLDGMTKEEIAKVAYVYNPYNPNRKEEYLVGEIVEQHGKLYKCKKKHKGDYGLMPNLDDGTYWVEINGNGEVVIPKKKRQPYYSDTTYKLNDEVERYGKNYKYIGKTNEAGKDPETEKDFWELIVE